MKNYIKHLVECQCILKIFEKKTKPLYHKFIVFSVIDENDNILEKFVGRSSTRRATRTAPLSRAGGRWRATHRIRWSRRRHSGRHFAGR